jgi:RNA polymerase sigma-70 factor, ECF subfamily
MAGSFQQPLRGARFSIRCRKIAKGYTPSKNSLAQMAAADDIELLQSAREGNATAFDTLIRRHDRFLYRIARSVLLDDYEAEDVVQETFIKAFKGLGDFRGEARLSTWLTRIALNEALARKRRRRNTVELEALQHRTSALEPSPMIAPAQDPELSTAQQQIRKLLERAIDGLPDSLRTVFVMRDVEELSTAEAARLLGLGEPTVKTRLHRARRMLRELLGDQIAASLNDVFPFERQRCDLLVERVLNHVGLRK